MEQPDPRPSVTAPPGAAVSTCSHEKALGPLSYTPKTKKLKSYNSAPVLLSFFHFSFMHFAFILVQGVHQGHRLRIIS